MNFLRASNFFKLDIWQIFFPRDILLGWPCQIFFLPIRGRFNFRRFILYHIRLGQELVGRTVVRGLLLLDIKPPGPYPVLFFFFFRASPHHRIFCHSILRCKYYYRNWAEGEKLGLRKQKQGLKVKKFSKFIERSTIRPERVARSACTPNPDLGQQGAREEEDR